MEISLEGKVALVTGVGPNIGSGVALALARYGAKVACNDVDEAAVEACIARIERNGGEAMAAPGDVTDEKAVQGYIDGVLSRWGRLDILVSNAALLGGRGVLDETAEAFERAVRVSALGTFLNTKHAGRAMASRGIKGSIVCISSSNGWHGSAGVCAYAFHKGGVNNFVRAAAMDLAPYGIRVNSYTPTAPHPDNPELLAAYAREGRTPFGLRPGSSGGLGETEGAEEEWRRPARFDGPRNPMVPMGTTGTPTDIGHAVAWLCSDFARLITGIDLVVDGGARAKNFAYVPAAPDDLAGPLPVIPLDSTVLGEFGQDHETPLSRTDHRYCGPQHRLPRTVGVGSTSRRNLPRGLRVCRVMCYDDTYLIEQDAVSSVCRFRIINFRSQRHCRCG